MRSPARHPQILPRRTFLGASAAAMVAVHTAAARAVAATADAPLLAYVGTFSSPLIVRAVLGRKRGSMSWERARAASSSMPMARGSTRPTRPTGSAPASMGP